MEELNYDALRATAARIEDARERTILGDDVTAMATEWRDGKRWIGVGVCHELCGVLVQSLDDTFEIIGGAGGVIPEIICRAVRETFTAIP